MFLNIDLISVQEGGGRWFWIFLEEILKRFEDYKKSLNWLRKKINLKDTY